MRFPALRFLPHLLSQTFVSPLTQETYVGKMEKASDPRSANLYLSHVSTCATQSFSTGIAYHFTDDEDDYRSPSATTKKIFSLSSLLLLTPSVHSVFCTKATSQGSALHRVHHSKAPASSV
jgi:hypothetical protein